MTMAERHTPTLWFVDTTYQWPTKIRSQAHPSKWICDVGSGTEPPEPERALANAPRIIACVNAFHSSDGRTITTEQITPELFWKFHDEMRTLTRWAECFTTDTPISAETLWREFPKAIDEANAILKAADGGGE